MRLAPGELIEPPPRRRLAEHVGIGGVLLALIGLIIFTRWSIGRVAAECDQSLYICFGHLLLHGQRLYTDLLDHKPPLIYLIYALAEKVTGFGDQETVLLSATGSVITLGGVYWAARQLGHSAWAGVFAAAVWAATCDDRALVGYTANTEVFLNAALAWGFALLLADRPSWGRSVGAGVAFAIGSLFKHVVAPAAAILVLTDVLCFSAASTWRQRLNGALVIAAVGVLAWAGVAGYFAARGRFHDFYMMVVRFNTWYVSSPAPVSHGPSGMANNLEAFVIGCGTVPATYPVSMMLIGGAAVLGAIGRTVRERALLVALIVASAVALALPGQYFNHYFQLLLPAFAIGLGTAFTTLFPHDLSHAGVMLRARLGGLLLLILFISQLQEVVVLCQTRDLNETMAAGRYLGTILRRDQQLFVWGTLDAPLYLYSQHLPAFGIMVENPVFDLQASDPNPLAGEMRHRVEQGLLRTRPALISVEADKGMTFRSDAVIASLIASDYRRWHGAAVAGGRELYWRDDLIPKKGAVQR